MSTFFNPLHYSNFTWRRIPVFNNIGPELGTARATDRYFGGWGNMHRNNLIVRNGNTMVSDYSELSMRHDGWALNECGILYSSIGVVPNLWLIGYAVLR